MKDQVTEVWIAALRRSLGTLGYRAEKVLTDVPEGFPDYEAGHGVRSPRAILSHMGDVISFAFRTLDASAPMPKKKLSRLWEEEVKRFRTYLEELDRVLARCTNLDPDTAARLLQGPLSDAMTHAGQLAMLKRMGEGQSKERISSRRT